MTMTTETKLRQEVLKLYTALKDLMEVIEFEELLPPSLSYMKQARKALQGAEHTDLSTSPDSEK